MISPILRKTILTLFLTLFVFFVKAQSDEAYWERWNKNYPEKDVATILKKETAYARKIEADKNETPYYIRLDALRFTATYLGKVKPLGADDAASIQRVLNLTGRKNIKITSLSNSCVLVGLAGKEYWMPIQKQMQQAFRDEVKPNTGVLLYCTFYNEHTINNKLNNNFMISEFVASGK